MSHGVRGRWALLASVVLGCAGCATTQLSLAGQYVEVAATTPTGCRFVGAVSGYEGFNAHSPEDNIIAVQAQLRNKAAELGGNVVTPTSQQVGTPGTLTTNTGWNGACPNCITMMGSAYHCPNRVSAAAPTAAASEPPQGAAGFAFGADAATAAKQCMGAGLAWEPIDDDAHRCSGTPADTGLSAKSRLRFCQGALCGVTLVVSTAAAETWATQYAALKDALTHKYGAPASSHRDEGGGMRSRWWWTTGQSIELIFGAVDGAAAIVVSYGSAKAAKRGAPNPNAL